MSAEERARLRQGLHKRGLSIRGFAARAGVHPATLSAILAGQSDPSPQTLTRLAGAWKDIRPHAATTQLLRDLETASP